MHLLLVLPLQVQPGLDVTPGLLEGLSLRDLGRVVGADPDHVGAQENQHVGTNLYGKEMDSVSGCHSHKEMGLTPS